MLKREYIVVLFIALFVLTALYFLVFNTKSEVLSLKAVETKVTESSVGLSANHPEVNTKRVTTEGIKETKAVDKNAATNNLADETLEVNNAISNIDLNTNQKAISSNEAINGEIDEQYKSENLNAKIETPVLDENIKNNNLEEDKQDNARGVGEDFVENKVAGTAGKEVVEPFSALGRPYIPPEQRTPGNVGGPPPRSMMLNSPREAY